MKNKMIKTFIVNIFFPCFILGGVVGIVTGVITFFFKYIASILVSTSLSIYSFVRVNLVYIPLLFLGLFALATLSYFIIKSCKCAKGGGIPTAVGILRGLITFRWLKNLLGTIISAFSTYFAGLSLGEEGQCVQIGTCIGKGVSKIAGQKEKAWERYVMTGGASAGFAVATGAPIAGVFFSLEEAHKRFSPMIVMVALSSTIFAFFTAMLLGMWTKLSGSEMMINSVSIAVLNVSEVWIPIVIGLVMGFFSCGVTHLFKIINKVWNETLHKLPLYIKIIIVFFLSGIIGLIIPYSLGGGIGLINVLVQRKVVLGIILILLVLKTFLSLFANTSGATGGLFIPTLCQGCLIGAVMGELAILVGLREELYLAIVIISMTSYLAAVQRVPITAIVFSVEVFMGLGNIVYILIAVFLSYMIIEMFNSVSLNDLSLNERLKIENKGREKEFIDATLEVQPNSFAIGKMIRDVFWPADCQVLSVTYNKKTATTKDGDKHIHQGDLLHVRYHKFTDSSDETTSILKAIVGDQEIKESKRIK